MKICEECNNEKYIYISCYMCKGIGEINKHECSLCHGDGELKIKCPNCGG